jgi:hypothetical protein
MKKTHASLFILTLSVILWCCTAKVDNVIEEPSNLSTCRIIPDSVNIKIKFGETQIIKTDKGDMEITLKKVNESCVWDCAGCDSPAGIFFDLKLKKDFIELPPILTDRCPLKEPRIFSYWDLCVYPYYESKDKAGLMQMAFYGDKIFALRELSPYPKTLEQARIFTNDKKYTVNLIIKNRCQP